MLVSGVSQSDFVIHVSIIFQVIFSFRLLQNIAFHLVPWSPLYPHKHSSAKAFVEVKMQMSKSSLLWLFPILDILPLFLVFTGSSKIHSWTAWASQPWLSFWVSQTTLHGQWALLKRKVFQMWIHLVQFFSFKSIILSSLCLLLIAFILALR